MITGGGSSLRLNTSPAAMREEGQRGGMSKDTGERQQVYNANVFGVRGDELRTAPSVCATRNEGSSRPHLAGDGTSASLALGSRRCHQSPGSRPDRARKEIQPCSYRRGWKNCSTVCVRPA